MKKLKEIREAKKVNYAKLTNNGKNPNVKRKEMALATYVEFTDPAKIYAMDNIYDHAEAVFGPYGGIYGEVFQNPQTNATILKKSKDGHAYFNSLAFTSRFVETVLATIREKTLYVSGHEGKTSRDGTTSLALLASATSKDLLIKRMINPTKYKVPSSVVKFTIDAIDANFRKIVDDNKNMVYDPITTSYTEDGFKNAINAISTTVDGNPLFIDAFANLMTECQAKGVDLTSSYKVSYQEKHIGEETTCKLKLNVGIRMDAAPLVQSKASSVIDYTAPVFILDGHMGDYCHMPFQKAFTLWLKELLTTKDENGFYLFSKYNPNGLKPPVFLYNRSTDKTMRMFADLEKYVSFPLKDVDGKEIIETVSPKFIFMESEDTSKEQYGIFTEIFSDSVISLNGLRRYILDEARKTMDHEASTVDTENIPTMSEVNKIDVTKFLPTNTIGILHRGLTLDLPSIEYDASVAQDIKTDSIISATIKTVRLDEVISTVAFDGSTLFVTPESSSYDMVIKAQREKLTNSIANYSRNSIEFDGVSKILNMFNTATITPSFTYKTEDEFTKLFDLYQDAQGVFESVHNHGVMAGGNVTALRYMDELYDSTLEMVKTNYKATGMSNSVSDKYIKFCEHVLDSIYMGYSEVYKTLLQEDCVDIEIDILQGSHKLKDGSNLWSYNITTAKWERAILESTRSTVDIFSSTMEVLSDMIMVKRVKINDERDVREIRSDFASLENGIVVHPITAKTMEVYEDERAGNSK